MQPAQNAQASLEPNLRSVSEAQPIDLHGGISPWRLLSTLPAAIYVTDANGRITYFNEAAATLWGCRPKLGSDQWCGSWRLYWLDGTPMPHDQCPMAITLKQGFPVEGGKAIAERPDGTRVAFIAFPAPLRDASGELVGAVNMLIDISDRQRAERVERRLAAIVESSDDAIVSKDLNGVIETWNKGAERLFGYLASEVIGKPITIIIPPDRQNEEVEILERIRRGEHVDHLETIRRRKDGSLVNISLSVSPILGEKGKVVSASKIARDITAQKRREEQINLLAREAEHRTKNLLALAHATVHLAQGDNVTDLKIAIEERLRALANAHALLAKTRWTGADLRQLVTDELSSYCRAERMQAEIAGPHLMLSPDQAQTMALAVHELATNAIKYGALSVPSGRVRIEWEVRRGDQLLLRWTETGGPAVKPPTRQGFGTRAIERIICGQLNGEVNFDWHESGVTCVITLGI